MCICLCSNKVTAPSSLIHKSAWTLGSDGLVVRAHTNESQPTSTNAVRLDEPLVLHCRAWKDSATGFSMASGEFSIPLTIVHSFQIRLAICDAPSDKISIIWWYARGSADQSKMSQASGLCSSLRTSSDRNCDDSVVWSWFEPAHDARDEKEWCFLLTRPKAKIWAWSWRTGQRWSGALCWYWTLGISCLLLHCLRAFLLQWVLAKLLWMHQQNPSNPSIALSTITSRQCATTTCLLSGEALLVYSCHVKVKLHSIFCFVMGFPRIFLSWLAF